MATVGARHFSKKCLALAQGGPRLASRYCRGGQAPSIGYRLTGQVPPVRRRLAGQALAEYALLIGAVMAAVTGISIYAKRGIQASIKNFADGIGSQTDGIRSESGDRLSDRLISGKVLAKESKVDTAAAQEVETSTGLNGTYGTNIVKDTMTTNGVLAPGGISSRTSVVVSTPTDP